MIPDTVELARQMLEAFRCRDFDAAMRFFAAHAVREGRASGNMFDEALEAVRLAR
jgi:hypothetical protein